MRLNLGCGRDYRDGWVNVDRAEIRCDVRAAIGQTLPFSDAAFTEIYASGVLEQIGPNGQFLEAMNECHRVLGRSGTLTAIVPNARFPIAFRDPFDCRLFTEETWGYFDSGNRFWRTYGRHYGFLPWRVIEIGTNANGIMTAVLEKQ